MKLELPVFESEEAEIRQAHQEKLLLCDAALIYWGATTDAWLSSKKADLQKVYGWKNRELLRAQAIYLVCTRDSFKTDI